MAKKPKKKRPAAPTESKEERAAKEAAKEQRRAEAAAAAAQRDAEARKAQRVANVKARGQWIALGAVVVALFGWAFIRSLPESGETDLAAWDLPAVANDPDDNGRLTLAEFSGKPTVVNLYANWCEACNAELPDFARVSDELRDDVNFVGINTQDNDDPNKMPERHGVDWWALGDDINGANNGSGLYESISARTGLQGMPITAFFDADGNFVTATSILNESSLRSTIAQSFGIS